jgi:hypothetical protein
MPFTHPDGFFEAREAHYRRFFGRSSKKIYHSVDFKEPHIDIHVFGKTRHRRFWTLVTSGMSNERQIEPEDGINPRAEIFMYVKEPQPWMFSVLKAMAEMPFEDKTFLHWYHTVPNGMPMTATPSVLEAFFFLPPYFEKREIQDLKLGGDGVDFLWLFPITEAERAYAEKHGSEELERRIEEAKLAPIVDEGRASVV